MEIELKVEQNKQPRCVKLRLSANLPHDFAGTVDYNRRDVWYKDDASAESLQRVFEYDIVYNSPNGSRLIGIYMCCQEFYRVGALCKPAVSKSTYTELSNQMLDTSCIRIRTKHHRDFFLFFFARRASRLSTTRRDSTQLQSGMTAVHQRRTETGVHPDTFGFEDSSSL